MDMIIDCREDKLIAALESDGLKKECNHLLFDIEQLEIGDIVYKKDGQIVCLVERKTLEDYAASIIDGRSKNQSIRISQLKNIHVIYLIEGHFIQKDHKFRGGITRDSLYSSIINRVVRDNFTIYRTEDINDTALIVTKIYDKLLENSLEDPNSKEERLEYLRTIKTSKKDNMTPANCFLCQLSQIPGVSIDMANIISKSHTSMYHLVMAYNALTDEEEKCNLLSELSIPIANNKSKRLGKVLSKRIYDYICPKPPLPKLKLKCALVAQSL
jgi:ERCC4-type nuclease